MKELAHGRAPTWPETPSIYGAFLPTVYIPQAAALALGERWVDSTVIYRFYPQWRVILGYPLARIGSILIGVFTTIVLAAIAGLWTSSRRSAVLAGVVGAAYPQLVFLNAYVNADSFTVLGGATLALALSAWATLGEGDTGLVAIAASAAFVVAGKPSGYFILIPTSVWLAFSCGRGRLRKSAGAWALAIFLVLTVPMLVWNGIRNDGDILGTGKFHAWLTQWGRADATAIPNALQLASTTLFQSSFGRFRNMDLPLPTPFYSFAVLYLAGGLVVGIVRVARSESSLARHAGLWLAGSVGINIALVVYDTWFVEFQAQGRWILLSLMLLTLVAVLAPASNVWRGSYVVFVVIACVASELLIFNNPCLP